MFGGVTAFTELVLDAMASASARTGVGLALVIGANRTKHPLEARTLARLAAQYAGRGVVGFGLANDERRGPPDDFVAAFAIAERAGLVAVPINFKFPRETIDFILRDCGAKLVFCDPARGAD